MSSKIKKVSSRTRKAVRSDSDLPPAARLLFEEIWEMHHASEEGCYAGDEYLAERIGAAKSSVRRYRRQLRDAGHMSERREGGRRQLVPTEVTSAEITDSEITDPEANGAEITDTDVTDTDVTDTDVTDTDVTATDMTGTEMTSADQNGQSCAASTDRSDQRCTDEMVSTDRDISSSNPEGMEEPAPGRVADGEKAVRVFTEELRRPRRPYEEARKIKRHTDWTPEKLSVWKQVCYDTAIDMRDPSSASLKILLRDFDEEWRRKRGDARSMMEKMPGPPAGMR